MKKSESWQHIHRSSVVIVDDVAATPSGGVLY